MKCRRKSLEEITRMDVAAKRFKIRTGTPYSRGFNICRMQIHPRRLAKDGHPHGTRTTAEVHHNRGCRQGVVPQQCQSLGDQQFRAAPRHKDARLNQDPAAGELCPAQDVFEGNTLHAAPDVPPEFRGATGFSQQEPGFIFGENTAGRPQQGDDTPVGRRSGLAVNRL